MDARYNEDPSLEFRAIRAAAQLRKITAALINTSKQLDAAPSLQALCVEMDDCYRSADDLINDVTYDLRQRQLTSPDSIYINYFLLMVTRYNSLFLKIINADAHHEVKLTPLLALLEKIKASPFSHPILGNANYLEIHYSIERNDNSFRPPVRANHNDVPRYFYREDQTATFIDTYTNSNKEIFLATQKTNFFGAFASSGQRQDKYMRDTDHQKHQQERHLFVSAWKKLEAGRALSAEETAVFREGEFYRSNGSPIRFTLPSDTASTDKPVYCHVGHATEIIQETINIVVDPINYECKSAVFYPRQTEPGVPTSGYPLIHAVLYSHNHHDHMDSRTVKEAFGGTNPLFIVPTGDRKYLEKWGFTNIIEIESWSDSIELTVFHGGKSKSVVIHALPAAHGSYRAIAKGMTDMNVSLYTGYLIHHKYGSSMQLVTGDTAVLDEEHYQQLENYMLENSLTVSTACIAAGPDRPRQYMACTHQSTADAITVHARLAAMNAKVSALAKDKKLSLEDLSTAPCEAIAYHQGCFRLGVLSYSDVSGTLTRTMAAIAFYQQLTLKEVLAKLNYEINILNNLRDNPISSSELKLENPYFAMMDQFERIALINTLTIFQNAFPDDQLTANIVLNYFNQHTYMPQPGMTIDFNQAVATPYALALNRLFVNRAACEDICDFIKDLCKSEPGNKAALVAALTGDENINVPAIIEICLEAYLKKSVFAASTKVKQSLVNKCLKDLNRLSPNNAIAMLIELRGKCYDWKTFDESQREEGHFEMLFIMLTGLLNPQSGMSHYLAEETSLRELVRANARLTQ